MITLSLIPTLGMLGLVVDFGYAYYRKQMARTAAVSAAIAAAVAVQNNTLTCNTGGLTCQDETACPASPVLSTSDNMSRGCLYAMQNGFVNSGSQTVTMEAHLSTSKSAPSGAAAKPTYWVAARITETNATLFSRVLGKASTTVAARSTTGVFSQPANACIYALAPTGQGMKVNGSVTVNSTCGVYIDSNSTSSPYALTAGGGATLTASKTQIVGTYDQNGGGVITPTPTTGVTPTTDPLAGVQPPSYPSGCDDSLGLQNVTTSYISSKMAANALTYLSNVFVECGGFSMSGNPNITLPSGTYIMKGSNMDLKNGTLNGSGVTFYLTGGFTGISINGNLNTSLTAPTSGSMHGMLFFQDRSAAAQSMNITINGGSGLILDGALYFPTQDVSYSGGSSTSNNYTALVANTITFTGNAYFKADLGGSFTGIGSPSTGVLE
jgi:hypothetical protein